MSPKRFWGKDMSEALRSVRSAMGNDALIVETENLPQESGGGVEITALSASAGADAADVATVVRAAKPTANPVDELRQELATLKSVLGWLAPGLKRSDPMAARLLKHGIAPDVLATITEAMKNGSADDRERLYQAIMGLVPSGGQIRDGVERLALIGSPGVGKTTAIIKLTVFETQGRNCRVGWIDADQRGLATGDMLAVYAGILGVRYQRVASRAEVKRAFEKFTDCELILVDTPGVNPRDPVAVTELGKMLDGVPNLRRALVISAVTNGSDMIDWVSVHRKTGLDSLFFTHMDECRYLGPVINAALSCDVPFSYVSLGQNLCGDLAVATPEVFASRLLTEVDAND